MADTLTAHMTFEIDFGPRPGFFGRIRRFLTGDSQRWGKQEIDIPDEMNAGELFILPVGVRPEHLIGLQTTFFRLSCEIPEEDFIASVVTHA